MFFLNSQSLSSNVEHPREMFDQSYDAVTLLRDHANSTINVIHSTFEANRVAKQNLLGLENNLQTSMEIWRISYFFGSRHDQALSRLLESVRSAIAHTGEVTNFLSRKRLTIQLYHDNAQSWLVCAQTNPLKNQCLIIL